MKYGQELVVVGSVAIDWIITPQEEREHSIGGAATFFGIAASYHTPVQLVGVVGKDFPESAKEDMRRHGISLEGLEEVRDGLTFRWKGRYHENMNRRDTLETHLNCFEAFSPNLPASYRKSPYVFLANIQPQLQASVLDQMERAPKFVGLDTMNLWIDIAANDLRNVLQRVDLLVINDEEALQLSGESTLVRAAQRISTMGPRYLVIKRGEHGAIMFGPEGRRFAIPALLIDHVADPTGAGDCFAGGLMGYLAAKDAVDDAHMRRAIAWGTVMVSFCVEGFSYETVANLSRDALDARFHEFMELIHVE